MTKIEIGYIASAITGANNGSFDDYKIRLWYGLIGDLDYGLCEFAIKKLLQVNKYPLTPAEIRTEYFRLKEYIKTGKTPLSPGEAYSLVYQALHQYGRYRYGEAMCFLKQNNEILYDIVKTIGFINICNTDPNFLRNEIERRYSEKLDKELRGLLISNEAEASPNPQLTAQGAQDS